MGIEELPDPPPPPEIKRRVRLYRYQWIGIALLAMVPIMAILGLFGENWSTAEARASGFTVTVEYPSRYRYKQLNSIDIGVRNTTAMMLERVTVSLDTAYANRFSTVRAIPSFEEPYTLQLDSLRPAQTRRVIIEIQAERYGYHSGQLLVFARDTARVPIQTLIFP